MNIVMASNLCIPRISGTSTYTYHFTKYLASQGNTLFMILPKVDGIEYPFKEMGVKEENVLLLDSWHVPATNLMIGFTQLNSVVKLGNYRKVLDFLKDKNIDLVYQQSHVFDTSYYTQKACRKLNIPRAIALHTAILHSNPFFDRILRIGEGLVLQNFFMNKNDLWVCVDEYTIGYAGNRFPKMKYINVPYGVEPLPVCNDPEILEKVQALKNKSEHFILSFGHITPGRDRVDLVQAMAILKEKGYSCCLVVIGEEQVLYPRQEAKKLMIEDSVVFLGRMPQSQLRPFIEAAELEAHWHLNDTLGGETSFGVASLETMATGCCCLSSCNENCYGHDMFEENVHYVKVETKNPQDIADKIALLLDDKQHRDEIKENAKQLVLEKLNWQTLAADFVKKIENRDFCSFT